jgi:hypothetical protein
LTTLNPATAGVPSRLPAESVAATANECLPRFRCLTVSGDAHAVNDAESRLQANVEPASIFVSGAAVSGVAGGSVGGSTGGSVGGPGSPSAVNVWSDPLAV